MTEPSSVARQADVNAREALTRITVHERECERRYQDGATMIGRMHQENTVSITRLHERIDSANKVNLAIAGGVLSTLAAVVTQIVLRLVHP